VVCVCVRARASVCVCVCVCARARVSVVALAARATTLRSRTLPIKCNTQPHTAHAMYEEQHKWLCDHCMSHGNKSVCCLCHAAGRGTTTMVQTQSCFACDLALANKRVCCVQGRGWFKCKVVLHM
jgi:hypothetical protein